MENLQSLYTLVGPAGVALIFVALYALYVSVWLITYLNRVWKNFRRDFLDLESGKERCLKDINPDTGCLPFPQKLQTSQQRSGLAQADQCHLAFARSARDRFRHGRSF